MGKSERFSKECYSNAFVPDYRHAIDATCDSEGLGSSGRIEVEMTASENSRAPKRKCISLNVDKSDRFSIPTRVISLSKISKSQKKELKLRLRSELEMVLNYQKKILSSCTDERTVSASSDIMSCSVGRKKPKPDKSHKQTELLSGQVKRHSPPGRNGTNLKQKASSDGNDVTLMKQCETLLKKLMTHKFGWVFKEAVDPVKLNVPDYYNVIKHPMDFGTIKSKIASGAYSSPLDFAADVRLTFSNAMTYNPPGNDVHIMADTLRKFFEIRWAAFEKKVPLSNSPLGPAKSGVSGEVEGVNQSSQSKKTKEPPMNHNTNPEKPTITMSLEEKMNLVRELESLQGDMLEKVINFLRESSADPNNDNEVEVDIEALSDETLFTLRKLLDDSTSNKHRNQFKGESCEVERLNESGVGNSLMHHVKDPVEEDVDIGGNDPPVSSYPPVKVEKDVTLRTSKCSSSSSSSSDSDSSSSDSDSASSSGSESNVARSPFVKSVKATAGTDVAMDQERSDVLDPVSRSRSGLNQTENSIHSKPECTDFDDQQEGGDAPSKRQISPQKLYRAALLRSRFADTILKAREKTLTKMDKGDPEKLRKEREELERQQREERARLQAEAKAVEDARMQEEAAAVAEAKRKLEMEREAARMALQKIEKTVEINENCEFLKDLEMLGSVTMEHLPSSVDETSPNGSHDGLGSFKFRGSNPLEQLGLYMKADYEDEDEGDGELKKVPLNDVEEGEID